MNQDLILLTPCSASRNSVRSSVVRKSAEVAYLKYRNKIPVCQGTQYFRWLVLHHFTYFLSHFMTLCPDLGTLAVDKET